MAADYVAQLRRVGKGLGARPRRSVLMHCVPLLTVACRETSPGCRPAGAARQGRPAPDLTQPPAVRPTPHTPRARRAPPCLPAPPASPQAGVWAFDHELYEEEVRARATSA